MTGEADRMSRAGNYVLGLMSAADRERAERDLEVDAAFREAVLRVAGRMSLAGLGAEAQAAEHWKKLAGSIAAMPHMRLAAVPAPDTRPAAAAPQDAVRRGLADTRSWRAAVRAIPLIAAFVAGYVAALWLR